MSTNIIIIRNFNIEFNFIHRMNYGNEHKLQATGYSNSKEENSEG